MTSPACHAAAEPLDIPPADLPDSPRARPWLSAILDVVARFNRAVASGQDRERPPHE